MTEYWVSQGNKWCDQCKIYIANNPLSIRTHELGQRHRDNVAKRLAAMRKENAAKEKEKQQTIKVLAQIEAKAKRSYEKDLAAASKTNAMPSKSSSTDNASCTISERTTDEWEYDGSGYYFNKVTNYYYDLNSGLYYNNMIGKWVTQEEAFKSSQPLKTPCSIASGSNSNTKVDSSSSKIKSGPAPGPVLPASKVPNSSVKAVPSSLKLTKRKRDEKAGKVSSEEAAAIAAREAARKRVQEREKPLLGLYNYY